MSIRQTKGTLTLLALGMGMLVPILYFGMQIVAAPFYPGYDFLSQTASELGSNHFVYASTFNAGVIVLGIVTLVAAVGCLNALLRLGTNPFLSWLIAAAITANGLSSLWAGLVPLPDPNHGSPSLLIAGMILLPFLFAAALWKRTELRPLKNYLILSIAIVLVNILFRSGVFHVDLDLYAGLIQRIFALAVFAPIGIGAYVLAKSLKKSAGTYRAQVH